MLKLTDIQILKLGKTLHHIKTSNIFYGQRYTDERVTSYDDMLKLPLLTFDQLTQGYPFAYCCADTKALTAGHVQRHDKEPVMTLYTPADTDHTAEMISRAFSIAEINDDDTIVLMSTEDRCPQYIYTCDRLRHFLIRGGHLSHSGLYQLLNDTDASCLLGDGSDLVKFVEYCREHSLDLTSISLRTGVFTGKPLTNGTRKHLEKETGMNIYQTSALGDLLTGMACDCRMHDGMHIWDDHYLAEIINPETDKHMPDGEEGELVVTTLSATALPLIRFSTGKKATVISREKCECGLDTPKITYVF